MNPSAITKYTVKDEVQTIFSWQWKKVIYTYCTHLLLDFIVQGERSINE